MIRLPLGETTHSLAVFRFALSCLIADLAHHRKARL